MTTIERIFSTFLFLKRDWQIIFKNNYESTHPITENLRVAKIPTSISQFLIHPIAHITLCEHYTTLNLHFSNNFFLTKCQKLSNRLKLYAPVKYVLALLYMLLVFGGLVSWLVKWLLSLLFGCSIGCQVSGWLVGWFFSWLVNCLIDWLVV